MILAARSVSADPPDFSSACPAAEWIDPFIRMCGHNRFVALQARFCAEEVVTAWTGAATRLVPLLEGRGRLGNQSATEADAKRNYEDAASALAEEIRRMQHYTALIAGYPGVMIDVPGSTGDATSLSCFNDAFHQVQEIVSYLDREIVRAKKIRRSALALMDRSAGRERSLAASLTESPARGGGRAQPVPSGRSVNGSSTITGEIREELLESKAAAREFARHGPAGEERPFRRRKGRDRESILAVFSRESRELPPAPRPAEGGGGGLSAVTAGTDPYPPFGAGARERNAQPVAPELSAFSGRLEGGAVYGAGAPRSPASGALGRSGNPWARLGYEVGASLR